MIKVQVKRHPSGDIEGFTIDGHAGYANPGEDIVCAAVSGISFGMINAVEMLLDVTLPAKQNDGGYLHCTVPELSADKQEKLQLLLEGMICSLRSVAMEYGDFVKVNDSKVKGR